MNKGFYTALGTPLDSQGNFCPESMTRQIEMQIDAGVSGLLKVRLAESGYSR